MAVVDIDIHESMRLIGELKASTLLQKQILAQMELGIWDLGLQGVSGQQAQAALEEAIEHKRDIIRNLEWQLQQEHRHLQRLEEQMRRQPGPAPR